jgi:hypothetical protein
VVIGTFYAPALGACGKTNNGNQLVVAVSHEVFDSFTLVSLLSLSLHFSTVLKPSILVEKAVTPTMTPFVVARSTLSVSYFIFTRPYFSLKRLFLYLYLSQGEERGCHRRRSMRGLRGQGRSRFQPRCVQ